MAGSTRQAVHRRLELCRWEGKTRPLMYIYLVPGEASRLPRRKSTPSPSPGSLVWHLWGHDSRTPMPFLSVGTVWTANAKRGFDAAFQVRNLRHVPANLFLI